MRTLLQGSAARGAATNPSAPWIGALQVWIAVGTAAVLAVPALRGTDPWFGWLPFWFVIAPAIDLLVLRHRRIARATGAWIRRLRAHRRSARGQAKPLRRRSIRARRGTAPLATGHE